MFTKCYLPALRRCCIYLLFTLVSGTAFSQFSPVVVTGFNQDVVAETGTSSLTTTTTSLDGVTISNKVMYTVGFKTTNAFGGGGIPDNGIITDASGSYQMAAYNGNNSLVLGRGTSGALTLTTPAKFNAIRLLCFATEGSSLINATLTFTDNSTTTALTNYTLGDWFNNTTYLVLSGIGRCTRATPASGADAYPTNPRMYYMEILLSCTDRQKTLQKISLSNVTTAGNNAPYPNACFFAVSGTSYSQTVTPTITNATCTAPGSATLAVTGSSAAYSISWNTTPIQTGPTATNLTAGTYQATITDGGGCSSVYPVIITGPAAVTMTAHADTTICSGTSFLANTVSNATSYSWTPTTGVSNAAIANPTLAPTGNTTYSVTGTLGACSITKTFTVTVIPAVTLTIRADTSVCAGASFNANTVSNATAFTWTPATGVSNTTIANPVFTPTAASTLYSVTATNGNCSNTKTFTATVYPAATANAGADATIFLGQTVPLQGSGSAGTYLWTPSTGLSSSTILSPLASPLVTTTYTLKITTAQGCSKTDDVIITVVGDCVKPSEAFTPNGDGFNDKWLITNGNCLRFASAQVYNRWGSKVFESADYKNDWDGTYKGKPLPDGTYYFVIHYELITGSVVIRKGNVTILR